MRIGEVLRITSGDIQEGFLTIQNPKSGRPEERVYVPRKILVRLSEYVNANDFGTDDQIFPDFVCLCLVDGKESRQAG